ncbi:MAG: hypothetical protein M3N21_06925 [Actinomycetota bacterium]|nr:hypothetical protein [Actinomycetota bacterium]
MSKEEGDIDSSTVSGPLAAVFSGVGVVGAPGAPVAGGAPPPVPALLGAALGSPVGRLGAGRDVAGDERSVGVPSAAGWEGSGEGLEDRAGEGLLACAGSFTVSEPVLIRCRLVVTAPTPRSATTTTVAALRTAAWR